jgi:hypothetical protein
VREVGLKQFDVPVDILEDSVPQLLEGLAGFLIELSSFRSYHLSIAEIRHRRGDSIRKELKISQIFPDSGSFHAILKVIIELTVRCLLEIHIDAVNGGSKHKRQDKHNHSFVVIVVPIYLHPQLIL